MNSNHGLWWGERHPQESNFFFKFSFPGAMSLEFKNLTLEALHFTTNVSILSMSLYEANKSPVTFDAQNLKKNETCVFFFSYNWCASLVNIWTVTSRLVRCPVEFWNCVRCTSDTCGKWNPGSFFQDAMLLETVFLNITTMPEAVCFLLFFFPTEKPLLKCIVIIWKKQCCLLHLRFERDTRLYSRNSVLAILDQVTLFQI